MVLARKKWSIYEAVILLNGYLEAQKSEQPMAHIAGRVSDELHRMAQNTGADVDKIHRNTNGVIYQIQRMQCAFKGIKIYGENSSLFAETVTMYRENRCEYDRILKEAMAMIGVEYEEPIIDDTNNPPISPEKPDTNDGEEIFINNTDETDSAPADDNETDAEAPNDALSTSSFTEEAAIEDSDEPIPADDGQVNDEKVTDETASALSICEPIADERASDEPDTCEPPAGETTSAEVTAVIPYEPQVEPSNAYRNARGAAGKVGSAQPKWNIHEAVILLDGYLEIHEKKQFKECGKMCFIKRISDDLRRMAVNNGIDIDDIYRNENDVILQIQSMDSAYKGLTVKFPATKLFTQTVAMYRGNRSEYDKFLEEARTMIYGKKKTDEPIRDSTSDGESSSVSTTISERQSRAERKFFEWLSEKASPEQCSDFYLIYKEIEQYCVDNHVLKASLFIEIKRSKTAAQLTAKLMSDIQFQRTFAKYGRKVHVALTMFELFCKTRTAQTTREEFSELVQNKVDKPVKNAHDFEQQPAQMLKQIKPKRAECDNAFDKLLAHERYSILKDSLKHEGIQTIEALKAINLWEFMNKRCLYSIQNRYAICKEISNELQDLSESDAAKAAFTVCYSGVRYIGSTPSNAFLRFLKDIALKYPLKFRSLIGTANDTTGIVVLHKFSSGDRLLLTNPTAYIDSNLSVEDVNSCIEWILKKCSAVDTSFTIEENKSSVPTESEYTSEFSKTPTANSAPMSSVPDDKKQFNDVLPETSFGSGTYTYGIDDNKITEELVLKSDLTGVSIVEIQNAIHSTAVGAERLVRSMKNLVEIKRRIIHKDAFVDFEDGADALEKIIDKLLKKNNGITTAKQLYDYARSEMAMFFNDNDITDQQYVYDLARYLFEKAEYHGKKYAFRQNTYISLPEISADSIIDIIKRYALEKGTTVTFKEIETCIAGLGLNTGSIRSTMQIDKKPEFLIYTENEYLYTKLMHMDNSYIEAIHSALRHLFADCDGHIIPRDISRSWYNLLPSLPASLPWTPLLLQQLIRFFPNRLEARTIIAMESQTSNTLHAMFVEKDSWIQDFKDAVAFYLHEEMPDRNEFEAEELRKILVGSGMISGNQLIWHMHIALGGDPRFIWNSDNSYVKVRI